MPKPDPQTTPTGRELRLVNSVLDFLNILPFQDELEMSAQMWKKLKELDASIKDYAP